MAMEDCLQWVLTSDGIANVAVMKLMKFLNACIKLGDKNKSVISHSAVQGIKTISMT